MLHSGAWGFGRKGPKTALPEGRTQGRAQRNTSTGTTHKNHRQRGFSLIELLVTVGIIGILAGVATPAYNKYRQNAAAGAAESEGTQMMKAFTACVAVGTKITDCDDVSTGKDLENCQAPSGSNIASSVWTPAPDKHGCFVDQNATSGKTAIQVRKVSGGFGAIYCIAYDPATGSTKTTKGQGKIGSALAAPEDHGHIATGSGECS